MSTKKEIEYKIIIDDDRYEGSFKVNKEATYADILTSIHEKMARADKFRCPCCNSLECAEASSNGKEFYALCIACGATGPKAGKGLTFRVWRAAIDRERKEREARAKKPILTPNIDHQRDIGSALPKGALTCPEDGERLHFSVFGGMRVKRLDSDIGLQVYSSLCPTCGNRYEVIADTQD